MSLKLRRYWPRGIYSTQGCWLTADGCFTIRKLQEGWVIESLGFEVTDWLRRSGLRWVTFHTRRDALAALELALSIEQPRLTTELNLAGYEYC